MVSDDRDGKCQTPNSIYDQINIFMHFTFGYTDLLRLSNERHGLYTKFQYNIENHDNSDPCSCKLATFCVLLLIIFVQTDVFAGLAPAKF